VPRRNGHHSFWDWLVGDDVPEYDPQTGITPNLRGGQDGAFQYWYVMPPKHEQVADILEEFNSRSHGRRDRDEYSAGEHGRRARRIRFPRALVRCELERPERTTQGEAGHSGSQRGAGRSANGRPSGVIIRIRTYVVETPVEKAGDASGMSASS